MSPTQLRDTGTELTAVIERIIDGELARASSPDDLHWGRQLLLAASIRYLAASEGPRRAQWLERCVRRRDQAAAGVTVSEHCSTWLDLLVVQELLGAGQASEAMVAQARRLAATVVDQMPRTADGLVGIEGPDGRPWAFTDTVLFALTPIVTLTRGWDDRLADEAGRQIVLHTEALFTDGHVAHGVDRRGGTAAGVDWSRSAGYLALGLADALRLDRLGPETQERVRAVAAPLFADLAQARRPDGLWPLHLGGAGSPAESSGTGFVAAALMGTATSTAAEADATAAAMLATTVPDTEGVPQVTGVAEEIPIEGVESYDAVRLGTYPWGAAGLVMFAAAVLGSRRPSRS